MKSLGITGGIGSGKSYVSTVFSAMGIPVYDSDSRTKALYTSDKELLAGLKTILGSDIEHGGVLNRRVMADRIFASPALMGRVRDFVYPFVMRDFCAWRDSFKRGASAGEGWQEPPFVILESAVILESDFVHGFMDKVLLITAPVEQRIARVMLRDGCSREQALARMGSQWSDSQREKMADYVIVSANGISIDMEVERVYKAMCEL